MGNAELKLCRGMPHAGQLQDANVCVSCGVLKMAVESNELSSFDGKLGGQSFCSFGIYADDADGGGLDASIVANA